MMNRHVRTILLTLSGLLTTVVLVGWRTHHDGFTTANVLMKDVDGETLTRTGSHEWDTAWGVWPYAYTRDWQRATNSVHFELVRVNYVSLAVTTTALILLWWSLISALRSAATLVAVPSDADGPRASRP